MPVDFDHQPTYYGRVYEETERREAELAANGDYLASTKGQPAPPGGWQRRQPRLSIFHIRG